MSYVSFYNGSGESIPAYGVMMVTSHQSVGGKSIPSVEKPDPEQANAGYLLNGPAIVPSGKVGKGLAPVAAGWALYDELDTPVPGATWGPVAGSWELGLSGSGFRIVGGSADGRVIVRSFCEPTTTDASSCGVCDRVDATALTIDLGSGFMAAEQYLMDIRCGGTGWLFTHASGTEYSGESDDETAPCDGESPITLTGGVEYVSPDAGGVVATFLNGGTPAAVFESETAWQPCTALRMKLIDFDPSCQCVAWQQFTCLVPVPPVA